MIAKRLRRPGIFVLIIFQLLLSCKKSEDPAPQHQYLINSTKLFGRTAAQIKDNLAFTSLYSLPVYDVNVYKITYKTKYKGLEIIASGIVSMPHTTDPLPMVSFQHGTIAAHSEAPSELSESSQEMVLYAGLGSVGFISVVPDFIGFGSSSDLLHPYYVESATAPAIIDMLQAAKELASDQKLVFTGNVFLAGYSQGGYATMAAHKAIEQDGLEGMTLVASFPAAGGYDVKAFQEYFFGLDTYADPFYLAYVALAYKNNYASWTAPLSDFFNEPFASRVPGLFDGTKDGGQINSELTTSIPGLVTADVLANIDTDPKYSYVVDAFTENSLTDWTPTIKMYMYHGDADITVPYENSEITYQKLIANGASPSVVTLTPLPGKNHSTGVLPYVEAFVPLMISLK